MHCTTSPRLLPDVQVPEKCGVPDEQTLRKQARHADQWSVPPKVNPESGLQAIAIAKVTNHDFFIGAKAFFFDLR